MGRRDAVNGSGNGRGREAQMGRRNAVRGTQRQRTSLRECSAHIAAVAAAAPQERVAAAVPAPRRGANNERWCCCQRAATAASRLRAPMSQALPAFHVQCSSLTPAGVVWSSFGARRRARARRRTICSPASWRCVPRRVSAWAKARRPEALSTPGGLGRYWAAQWHLARAVGKRLRGCCAKRLYVHKKGKTKATRKPPEGSEDSQPEFRPGHCSRPTGTRHARRSNKKEPRARQRGPGIPRGWRGSVFQLPSFA